MPMVGGKKFPYTEKGKKAAKKLTRKKIEKVMGNKRLSPSLDMRGLKKAKKK